MFTQAMYESIAIVLSLIHVPLPLVGLFLGVIEVYMTILLVFIVLFVVEILRIHKTKLLYREFKKLVNVESDVLALPERALVEKGVVRIKHYIESSGRITTHRTDISISDGVVVETDSLRIRELCSSPFYVFIERAFFGRLGEPVNVYLVAPGFIVRSGRFEGVVGICIDPDSIPSRRLEIRLDDPPSEAIGIVELERSSIKATVAWSRRAPVTQRVVYDSKTGVYRIEAQPSERDDVRGVRIEVCLPAIHHHRCITLAKTTIPNSSSTGEISWKINNRTLLYIHRRLNPENLAGELRKSIESSASTKERS